MKKNSFRLITFLFSGFIITTACILIALITACSKDTDDNYPVSGENGIADEIQHVPFFFVEKGDSVPKYIWRDMPIFEDTTIEVVVSSEDLDKINGSTHKSTSYYSSYITDLYIQNSRDATGHPPAMYTKLWCNDGNKTGDLNEGAGGNFIYLWYTRMTEACPYGITNLYLHAGGQYPNPNPVFYYNYTIVRNCQDRGYPGIDLNDKAGGDYIYLFEKRMGSPGQIKEIALVSTTSSTPALPDGWAWVTDDGTDYGTKVNLNQGAGGRYIYLRIKR
ncbi:MAG: hypothetical protein JSV22_01900 [Bacteroidales bacterium]|nr:MAG: hypothetical protein JSV22_01900 [Bacteroidales bacterium]